MNPLVHCAQGKSRSGVICIGFMALIKPTVTVEDLAKEVKSRRGMPPKTSKLRTSVNLCTTVCRKEIATEISTFYSFFNQSRNYRALSVI